MNLIIMGPPGSGKSTQAKLLAKKLSLIYVSTGSILRKLYEAGDPLGEEAEEYMSKGELVPSELMDEILLSWLDFQEEAQGFVFDGYPRTLENVRSLEKSILHQDPNRVIYIDVPEEVCIKRLLQRAKIENRADDTPAVIKERLKEYHQETEPILDYYQQKNLLTKVDGRGLVETTHQNLVKNLTHNSKTVSILQ